MWGFFVGVTLAFVLYSFYEEWQQRRVDKKRLADMRKKDVITAEEFDAKKAELLARL